MNTNINTNLTRANKLTVKVNTTGILQGDFFRTHKHMTTVVITDTTYQTNPKANKSAIREGFRQYLIDNAATYGIKYEPEDQRTPENIRKATYTTNEELAEDAIAMVQPDISTLIAKMPFADRLDSYTTAVESITAKTHTGNGTDLSKLGIEDGKYSSNGRWAWADLEMLVTLQMRNSATDTATTEIYQMLSLELVSGQLKKPAITQTGWNTNLITSMIEAGILTEEEAHPKKAKAEKSAKAGSKPKADGDPTYTVTYAVKAGHQNGEEHEESMKVTAKTAKDACKLAKELYKKATGNTAFRPKATKVEG